MAKKASVRTLVRTLVADPVTRQVRDISGKYQLKNGMTDTVMAAAEMDELVMKAQDEGWKKDGGLLLSPAEREVAARLVPTVKRWKRLAGALAGMASK